MLAGEGWQGQVSYSQGSGLYSRAVGHCGSFSGEKDEGQMCVLGSLPISLGRLDEGRRLRLLRKIQVSGEWRG